MIQSNTVKQTHQCKQQHAGVNAYTFESSAQALQEWVRPLHDTIPGAIPEAGRALRANISRVKQQLQQAANDLQCAQAHTTPQHAPSTQRLA